MTEVLYDDGLDRAAAMVAEFHHAFGFPVGNTHALVLPPTAQTANDLKDAAELVSRAWLLMRGSFNSRGSVLSARAALILEELHELLLAFADRLGETKRVQDSVDGLADLLYVVLGSFAAFGVSPSEAFGAVHSSNMSKTPSRQATGEANDLKPAKGPNYHVPNLAPIVARLLSCRNSMRPPELPRFLAPRSLPSKDFTVMNDVAWPGRCVNTAWIAALRALTALPSATPSRNGPMRELRNISFRIDPDRSLMTVPGRNMSHRYAAGEIMWFLTGDANGEFIKRYAPSYGRWLNAAGKADSAYGPKLLAQLPGIVEELLASPGSRRAVLSMFRGLDRDSLDVPCMLSMNFHLRGGVLQATVHQRSQDVWLGMPYDVFTWSMVQRLVAWKLGAPVGSLVYSVDSLHLYEKHLARSLAVLVDWDRGLATGLNASGTGKFQPVAPELPTNLWPSITVGHDWTCTGEQALSRDCNGKTSMWGLLTLLSTSDGIVHLDRLPEWVTPFSKTADGEAR